MLIYSIFFGAQKEKLFLARKRKKIKKDINTSIRIRVGAGECA